MTNRGSHPLDDLSTIIPPAASITLKGTKATQIYKPQPPLDGAIEQLPAGVVVISKLYLGAGEVTGIVAPFGQRKPV